MNKPIKLLYLSEDYLNTKVHHNLCNHLCELGVDVTVYTVLRSSSAFQNIDSTFENIKYDVVKYEFSGNEKRYKYDFRYKVKSKYGYLKSNVNLQDFDIVLAGTLFIEGAIALKINEEFGVPYISCVRGADVNFYFRKMFHLWLLGRNIVCGAAKMIPITKSIKDSLLGRIGMIGLRKNAESKCEYVNNGIDEIWINNYTTKKSVAHPYKLLFIGHLEENKNIVRLQNVVVSLIDKYPDIKLTIIGGAAECYEDVISICKEYLNNFEYLGKIYDKQKLLTIVREHHIFTMVSHSETFGLVYIETLSQGLPVLYTQGQGIDGVFSKRIGEAVISNSDDSIKQGLEKLLTDYDNYEPLSREDVASFSWSEIAKKYMFFLKSILENKNK